MSLQLVLFCWILACITSINNVNNAGHHFVNSSVTVQCLCIFVNMRPCHAWALLTAKKSDVGKQPRSYCCNQCKNVRLIMVQPGFCLLLLLDLDKLLNFHCFSHNLCNGKKCVKFMWKLLKLQLTFWGRLLTAIVGEYDSQKLPAYKSCRWEKMIEKTASASHSLQTLFNKQISEDC